MKHITTFLTFMVLFFITVSTSFAQCTIDESFNEPGIYPENLPNVCVNVEYNEVLQYIVPNDTTFDFGGFQTTADIDSAEITSIDGLPEGFEYTCHNERCMVINEEDGTNPQGCISIVGTPTNEGIVELTINIILYGEGTQYSIGYNVEFEVYGENHAECEGDTPTSIESTNFNKTSDVGIYPNPASGGIVHFTKELSNIQVFDVLGNPVLEKTKGNSINTQNLSKGIYIISTDEGKYRLMVD